jgi:DNA-binding transcriptional ArsR family regulator
VSRRSPDQDLIDELAAWMQAPDTETARTNGHAIAKKVSTSASAPSDEQVIEKCRAAKNAPKFEALFDRGDAHAYHGGDDSGADLALMGILTYWTQDGAQLERLFSASALGQRAKWRNRHDYRERTIRRALSRLGETYDWSKEAGRARPLKKDPPADSEASGPADSPYIGKSTKSATKLELVRFASRRTPAAREFVIPDLIPRYHATTLYGWGGTAKSLIAVLLAMSVAGGREKFFDREVAVHGPALFVDFELDPDEQHRRVMQLAAGLGTEVPEGLLYVSTLGVRTHEAVEFALTVCEEHQAVMVILDSLGPAMVGDMAAARDVIEFHNSYIAPFKEARVTPILVDHQARQQAGEGYQSKGAFGSAYKEHLSRSLIQVEAGDRSTEQGTLNIRIRHKKTNFGTLVDPFDVALTFSDEEITAELRDLTPAERAQETTLNAEDRVLAALADGPAYPDELAEATGLARSTVKNKINALKKAGRVTTTGKVQGQMEQVALVDPRTRPIKDRSAKSATTPTVKELFADPPNWLTLQVAKYRGDPGRHIEALCAAVAAVVLDDPMRGSEVREEVKQALEGS